MAFYKRPAKILGVNFLNLMNEKDKAGNIYTSGFQTVKNAWLKRVDTQMLQIIENMQNLLKAAKVKTTTLTCIFAKFTGRTGRRIVVIKPVPRPNRI